MKLLTFTAACTLAFTSPGSACMRAPFPSLRSPGTAHFIGAGTADTLRAPAVPADTARHLAAVGTAYGQVVAVERMGGLGVEALPSGVKRVVVVPWGLAPDCQRAPWHASARWNPVGLRTLFLGALLRDPAHWVDGIPTFDIQYPSDIPYHPDDALRRIVPDSMLPPLSVDEAFAFFDALPDRRLLETTPREALAPMWSWMRRNPAQARRYPAVLLIFDEQTQTRHEVARATVPPFAGTLRVTVTLGDAEPRVFYARTFPRARGGEWEVEGEPYPPRDPEAPAGYWVTVAVAPTVEALPTTSRGRPGPAYAYVAVGMEPVSTGADGEVWRGKVGWDMVMQGLGDDPVLRSTASLDALRMRTPKQAGETPTPAHITRAPDGAVRIEQTTRHHDGRLVRIEAVRVSDETMSPP